MKPGFEDKYTENKIDWWWYVARRKLILQLMKEIKYTSVLEIGCGSGQMGKHINNYIGLDISKRVCTGIIGDAHTQPFKDGSFDLILLLDVLEHTEDLCVMDEVKRVLCHKGLVLLTVPAFNILWSQHDIDNNHKRRYTRGMIPIKGFKIERFTYWNGLLFPLMFLMKKKKTQLTKIPKNINYILTKILELENYIISKNIRIPIGVSLIYILRSDS